MKAWKMARRVAQIALGAVLIAGAASTARADVDSGRSYDECEGPGDPDSYEGTVCERDSGDSGVCYAGKCCADEEGKDCDEPSDGCSVAMSGATGGALGLVGLASACLAFARRRSAVRPNR